LKSTRVTLATDAAISPEVRAVRWPLECLREMNLKAPRIHALDGPWFQLDRSHERTRRR
jgi:hypothetical protein